MGGLGDIGSVLGINSVDDFEDVKIAGLTFEDRIRADPSPEFIGSVNITDELKKSMQKKKKARAAKPTIQPFNIAELSKGLKQSQATTGKAIDPRSLEAFAEGAIRGQIDPAIAREDLASERRFRARKEARDAAAARTKGGADLGGAVGAGVGTFFGPAGTAIGAGVGQVAGGVLAGQSVLCTELEAQGFISKKLNILATNYRIDNIEQDVYEGYLMWAIPLTKLMQESGLITWLVSLIWIPVTYEMAHRANPRIKSSWYGKIFYEGLTIFSRQIRGRAWLAHSKI